MISPQIYRSFVDTPELAAFLDHVFKQVDTQKFMRVYRESVQQSSCTQEIYEKCTSGQERLRAVFLHKFSSD